MFTGRLYLEVYPCHGFINENRYHEIVPKHLTNHLYASNKKATERVAFLSKSLSRLEKFWWRFRDSNPGPADYDSVALTD